MLTPQVIDWAFYRLDQNLLDNNQIRDFYEPIFKRGHLSLAEDLEELALTLSESTNHEINEEHFCQGKRFDTDTFTKRFYERNGMMPYPYGLAFKRKNWKKVKKSMGLKRWVGGVYYQSRNFQHFLNTDYDYYLRNLGFIMMGMDKKASYGILEHECLHSCFEKYSSIHLMQNIGFSKNYEPHHYQYLIEARLLNEVCSYQEELVSHFWSTKRTLRRKYLPKIIDEVGKLFEYGDSLPWRLKRQLKYRINKDLVHANDLIRRLPRHMLVPLFFSMGPTSKEIKKMQLISPFESMIRWSKIVKKPILLEKTKSILKAKGYRVD